MRRLLVSLTALTACATTAPRPDSSPGSPPDTAPRWLLERPEILVGGYVDQEAFERWVGDMGLPAVSDDGSLVALAHVGEDGGRGAPNLAVRVIEVASGRVVFEERVLAPGEAFGDAGVEPEGDGAALAAELDARVDRANDYLAAKSWHLFPDPLVDLSSIGANNYGPGVPFPGPLGVVRHGLTVTFREPRLVVAAAGRVLVDADFPEWSAAPRTRCYPDELEGLDEADRAQCMCANPATLRGGAVDLERGVLLMRLGYLGDDLCWEPDSVDLVLPLVP